VLVALTTLAHPHSAVFAILGTIVAYEVFSRSGTGLLTGVRIAGVALALTSPWWGVVIFRHGPEVFTYAHGVHHNALTFTLERPFSELSSSSSTQRLIDVAAIMGAVYTVRRREWFPLVLWIVFTSIYNDKTADAALVVLAGGWLATDLRRRLRDMSEAVTAVQIYRRAVPIILVSGLILTMVCAALVGVSQPSMYTHDQYLTESDTAAMNWINQELPRDARVLVPSPVREWYPTVANRPAVGLSRGNGIEWLPPERREELAGVVREANACESPACLANLSDTGPQEFEYIYLKDVNSTEYQESDQWRIVYHRGSVVIARRTAGTSTAAITQESRSVASRTSNSTATRGGPKSRSYQPVTT